MDQKHKKDHRSSSRKSVLQSTEQLFLDAECDFGPYRGKPMRDLIADSKYVESLAQGNNAFERALYADLEKFGFIPKKESKQQQRRIHPYDRSQARNRVLPPVVPLALRRKDIKDIKDIKIGRGTHMPGRGGRPAIMARRGQFQPPPQQQRMIGQQRIPQGLQQEFKGRNNNNKGRDSERNQVNILSSNIFHRKEYWQLADPTGALLGNTGYRAPEKLKRAGRELIQEPSRHLPFPEIPIPDRVAPPGAITRLLDERVNEQKQQRARNEREKQEELAEKDPSAGHCTVCNGAYLHEKRPFMEPCGHPICCAPCWAELGSEKLLKNFQRRCPMCRLEIFKFMEVFA